MKITVTVPVPEGTECGYHNERGMGVCRFYKSRCCALFNKVIYNQIKVDQCLESEDRPDRIRELETMYNAAAQEANKRGKSWDSKLPMIGAE